MILDVAAAICHALDIKLSRDTYYSGGYILTEAEKMDSELRVIQKTRHISHLERMVESCQSRLNQSLEMPNIFADHIPRERADFNEAKRNLQEEAEKIQSYTKLLILMEDQEIAESMKGTAKEQYKECFTNE